MNRLMKKNIGSIPCASLLGFCLLILLQFGAILVPGISFCQPEPPEDKGSKIGAYREKNLDMTVKVSGGEIKVWRIWQGDKKTWTINPAQEDLQYDGDEIATQYGYLLKREISRGPINFRAAGAGLAQFGSFSRQNTSANPAAISSATQTLLGRINMNYCVNEGEQVIDTVIVNPSGPKYVTMKGRFWSQYSPAGNLLSFGTGQFLLGKILWELGYARRNGIADIDDRQVIFYDYDTAGRISVIRDYQGQEVRYFYNSQNLIERVVDADGVVTTYSYVNGNITQKVIGDVVGIPPGEERDHRAILNLAYSSTGELVSTRDEDGVGSDFEYAFDQSSRIFTETKTNTDGRSRRVRTDEQGNLLSVEEGGEYRFRVDILCEDSAIIDQNNRITYIDRDRFGYVKRVIFPDDRELSLEHSNTNWPERGEVWGQGQSYPWGIVRANFPNGTTVAYERDTNGKIRKAIETTGGGISRTWSFNYDSRSNLIEERLQASVLPDDLKDRKRRFEYDSDGNLLWEEDAYGNRWTYAYTIGGELKQMTSPDGKVWHWDYNRKGQLISYRDPIGYERAFEYTRRGLVKRFIDRYDVGLEAITRYRYNSRGLVTKLIDPLGQEWRYEYNDSGEVTAEIDPEAKRTEYGYDHKGRIRRTIDGNGSEIGFEYYDTAEPGQAPQVTFPFTPIIRIRYPSFHEDMIYNLAGQLVRRKRVPDVGTTEETRFEYGEDNRLSKIIRPDGEEQTYTWDQMGRPLSVNEPGIGLTTVTYPDAEKRTLYHDPVGGTIEQEFNLNGQLVKEIRADGTNVTYDYDVRGNLKNYRSSSGNRFESVYDDANRMTEMRTYATATSTTPVRTVLFRFNLRGDLLEVNDTTGPEASGTIQLYTRDPFGRVLTASTNYGPFTKSHSLTYTPNGNLSTMTAADGTQYQYLWDGADNFQGMTIPGQGSLTLEYINRFPGQPVAINYPGGTRQTIDYDDLLRTKRIRSLDNASATVMDYNYSYEVGPLDGAKLTGIATETGNSTFGYDSAFRLTSAVLPDGSSEGYSYDGLSRRQPTTGAAWTYDANAGPLNNGTSQYTYDVNGNRRTKTSGANNTQYTYSRDERLVKVEQPVGTTIAEYKYDFFGRRLKKTVSGVETYYYYNDEGLSAELDSTGALTKSYYFTPSGAWTTNPLFQKTGSGTQSIYNYYHNDHLGTPQRMTNSAGAVTWAARYKPFGAATITQASLGVTNNLRFPGQYADAETGLHHNFQRNYDPELGSYLEQDPYGIIAGPNRYGYATGNPLMYGDPTGEIPILAIGLIALDIWAFYEMEAYSGFPLISCLEALYRGCLPDAMDNCLKTGVNAFLAFGVGAVLNKVVPLVLPVINARLPRILNALADETGAVGNISRLKAARSVNQMRQQVQRGQAPRTISRIDKADNAPGSKPHVHFKDGSALRSDGQWKHGGRQLTKQEENWLRQNGWQVP